MSLFTFKKLKEKATRNEQYSTPIATSKGTPSDNSLRELRLWCLIEGQILVEVSVAANKPIAILKELIYSKGRKCAFDGIDANFLVLWKVDIPLNGHNDATLRQLKFAENDGSLLDSAHLHVSYYWPSQPADNMIHVVVKCPLAFGTTGTSMEEPNLSAHVPRQIHRSLTPPRAPENYARRRSTVEALYKRLNFYSFIQVRGTPGSGKTTLAKLLADYIRNKHKIDVIWISGWCGRTVENSGGHRQFFKKKGWVEGRKTVFIFDEAQLTYQDVDLWRDFFKNLQHTKDTQAIIFTSYGSPTMRFFVVGTPIHLSDKQRVTLKAVPHQDNLSPVGLCFTENEMDEMVSNLYTGHYFHQQFLHSLFLVTDGHAGAICDVMGIIVTNDTYRRLKSTGERYTWDMLLQQIGPRQLFMALSDTSVFTRGLPRDEDLQNVGIAEVFFRALRDRYVVNYNTSSSNYNSIMICFKNGWLHSDKLAGSSDSTVIYFFASPLHRWFVEWKLWNCYSPPPIATDDILTFVTDIIKLFSPTQLATERNLPFGGTQPVPEAQYQVEFYRCCSNRSIVTFPEYGTRQGRVDFYIPAKEWGVELLQNGDRLAQHSGRFSNNGSYAITLSFSDYIILDCRTTYPQTPHPNLRNLHHIVFSDKFTKVIILNNKLECITTFQLLASA